MIKVPPYLQPGDTIGIVCPAGYMDPEKAQTCLNTLKQWGFNIKIGKTLGSNSQNYFSGTDQERLEDFQQMLDDDAVNAILFGRGGYGIGRIIDQIKFKKFRKQPKWLIGYSDITLLHAHIFSNYKILTLHSPMAAAFNDGAAEEKYVLSLRDVLNGKKSLFETRPNELNKQGEAKGRLVGGNLALLAHIVGTSSDINTSGRLLFLEDIGEYLYNADRMLYQLKRSGKFDKLSGLIIGGFIEMKDTERPFGKTIYEIIHEIIKDADYPICFGFPVSHGKENYPLKIGGRYKLEVGKDNVILKE
ncbi:MAG: S66 peptidase family protein [Flavitalea sp.]